MTDSDTFVEPPVFYCTDAIHRDIQDRARAEATAAAEQRLRERIAALREYPAWHACIERVLALLDTPPPASPRQGEPVDVDPRHRGYREGRAAVLQELVEYLHERLDVADRIVAESDGPLPTADEVRGILAEPAAALSEPAEAGEPDG